MSHDCTHTHAFHETKPPPASMLKRPKALARHVYDLVGSPLRLAVLPDAASEKLGLTSLRAERFAAVLPEMRGRALDVGAGDNWLIRLYRAVGDTAAESVGVDTHDWGGGCMIVPAVTTLPFQAASFDTVTFIACLNHIPERRQALSEARRVLKPGGRVVITMINRLLGGIGHAIWWYSEDKHRHVHEEEFPGMNRSEVVALLNETGFRLERTLPFVYGLNTVYVAAPTDRGNNQK